MSEQHLAQRLFFDIRFAARESAEEQQAALYRFASQRAPRVIDEVFQAACEPQMQWRLDRLEVDLGMVFVDEMESEWERRLRERLGEALQESGHRERLDQGTHGAGHSSEFGQQAAHVAAFADLRHFLQFGVLPWGGGSSDAAIARLVQLSLRHHGAELSRWMTLHPQHALRLGQQCPVVLGEGATVCEDSSARPALLHRDRFLACLEMAEFAECARIVSLLLQADAPWLRTHWAAACRRASVRRGLLAVLADVDWRGLCELWLEPRDCERLLMVLARPALQSVVGPLEWREHVCCSVMQESQPAAGLGEITRQVLVQAAYSRAEPVTVFAAQLFARLQLQSSMEDELLLQALASAVRGEVGAAARCDDGLDAASTLRVLRERLLRQLASTDDLPTMIELQTLLQHEPSWLRTVLTEAARNPDQRRRCVQAWGLQGWRQWAVLWMAIADVQSLYALLNDPRMLEVATAAELCDYAWRCAVFAYPSRSAQRNQLTAMLHSRSADSDDTGEWRAQLARQTHAMLSEQPSAPDRRVADVDISGSTQAALSHEPALEPAARALWRALARMQLLEALDAEFTTMPKVAWHELWQWLVSSDAEWLQQTVSQRHGTVAALAADLARRYDDRTLAQLLVSQRMLLPAVQPSSLSVPADDSVSLETTIASELRDCAWRCALLVYPADSAQRLELEVLLSSMANAGREAREVLIRSTQTLLSLQSRASDQRPGDREPLETPWHEAQQAVKRLQFLEVMHCGVAAMPQSGWCEVWRWLVVHDASWLRAVLRQRHAAAATLVASLAERYSDTALVELLVLPHLHDRDSMLSEESRRQPDRQLHVAHSSAPPSAEGTGALLQPAQLSVDTLQEEAPRHLPGIDAADRCSLWIQAISHAWSRELQVSEAEAEHSQARTDERSPSDREVTAALQLLMRSCDSSEANDGVVLREHLAKQEWLRGVIRALTNEQRQSLRTALKSGGAGEQLFSLLNAEQRTLLFKILQPLDYWIIERMVQAVLTAWSAAVSTLAAREQQELKWRFIVQECCTEQRLFEIDASLRRLLEFLCHAVGGLRASDAAARLAASLRTQTIAASHPSQLDAAKSMACSAERELPVAFGRKQLAAIEDEGMVSAERVPVPAASAICNHDPDSRAAASDLAWALAAVLELAGGAVVAAACNTTPQLPAGESLYLRNAGMVLAGPYLPRLFAVLGLVREDAFVSEAAMERAVHMLQFMVNGAAATPEYRLPLNKLLCGMPFAVPVCSGIELSHEERTTVEQLLEAMIQHWTLLGSTSVAGLRETFLQREGRLTRMDDHWHLLVEPRPFDMLLDQLPWSYTTVKFPWMEQVLHVQWR